MLIIAQSLTIFFLVSAGLSSLLLALAYQWDQRAFDKLEIDKGKITPGVIKSAKLFGQSQVAKFQVLYLLSLIFILFAYVGLILLILHLIIWLFDMI